MWLLSMMGKRLLKRLKSDPEKYDLLITDIKMPVTDGLALIQSIIELKIELPTLLMTGYADQKAKAMGLGSCGSRRCIEAIYTGSN